MSAKAKPIILKARHRVKDDCLSPSSIELFDLLYLETCLMADAIWESDWNFCPVCMARFDETGRLSHKPRTVIEQ